MKYNTYIFDFDFTLADATPGIVSCANHALSALNFESMQREEIRKTVGLTLKETFFALTGISDEILAAEFASLFKEKADEVMTASTTLFPDTTGTLTQLKTAGHKTAIVTNKYRFRIEDALNKFNIAGLIDCIVGLEDVGSGKPSPEGLLKALDYLTAGKSGVLYIGDSLIDAKTAANASVDFAAVITGTTSGAEFKTLPHVLVAGNLSELVNTAILL